MERSWDYVDGKLCRTQLIQPTPISVCPSEATDIRKKWPRCGGQRNINEFILIWNLEFILSARDSYWKAIKRSGHFEYLYSLKDHFDSSTQNRFFYQYWRQRALLESCGYQEGKRCWLLGQLRMKGTQQTWELLKRKNFLNLVTELILDMR